MNLLRFAAHGAPKSLLLKNSYRCASYNSAIHRGVDREARAESTFDRGSRDSSSRPPYTPREGSSRPPYTPREGSSRPPYTPREGSSRPPYTPREGGSRPPYTPREGSSRPPYTPRDGSSRPPYTPRDGSSRPPYTPRDGSSRPPYTPRDGSSRPPYTPREGGSRPPFNREDGGSSRPPFKRDYEGGSSRPPYTPREGGSRPPFNREDGGSSRPPFKRDYEGGSSRPPFKRDYEGGSSRPPFNKDRDASSPRPYNRDSERPTARRDDRYAAPARDYVSTPRRTIQKVNQDSEWIYGTSVVEAALKSNRRQLFRLYIHSGENRTATSRERDIKLKNLARGLKIDVREVEDSSILDSMSNSRPHNGYVLEASKLLKTPIISLSNVSFDRTAFGLQISQHDFTESGIILNELPQTIPNRDPTRYPLVLMLDEILDPGNLGAILRSAYFMGCSALMVAERNCAPLSPTCLKSSAGASEYMPILTQINPARLIEASKEAGWKFFGAAPRPKYASSRYIGMDHNVVKEALKTSPVVLLMGGEAEGIRESIKKLCDKCVSITAAEDVDRGIDSLNVSVAAGVLMQAFLGGRKAIPVLEAGMEDVVEDVKAESGIAAAEEDVTAEEDVATEEDVVADEAAVDETVELESTEELTETSDEPAKSHM